jgi:hypothetical protein
MDRCKTEMLKQNTTSADSPDIVVPKPLFRSYLFVSLLHSIISGIYLKHPL